MRQIALSYRRADSAAMTGRIFDELSRHFGMNDVFMDIDAIPLGIDFRNYIDDALKQAKVVVVIVGPRWLGTKRAGQYRIMEETDPVRIEVETAMRLRIPVVPVLVDGAQMPRSADLPESLRDFSFKNAAEIDAGRDFHPHMNRLKKFLEGIVGVPPPAAEPVANAPDPVPAAAPPPAPKPAPEPEPARVLVAERPVPSAASAPTLAEFLKGAAAPVPAPGAVAAADPAIPAELLAKWSWGPFFLPLFWVWWNADTRAKVLAVVFFVISFIPVVGWLAGFGFAVYLGVHGNQLMASNRRFRSRDEFVAVQTAWARWGLGVFLAVLVVSGIVTAIDLANRNG
jgi:TIR domain